MTGPELCVGAIAVADDCLLMVRRGHRPAAGQWAVPGGRVEPGETLAEAVVREVEEETGLEAVCDALIGWVERIDADRHLVILDFGATVLDMEARGRRPPVAGDDAAESAWVPLSSVAGLDLVEGMAEFLHQHGILPTLA